MVFFCGIVKLYGNDDMYQFSRRILVCHFLLDYWNGFILHFGLVLRCQFSKGILKCHFLSEFRRWEVSNPSIWVCLWSPDLNLKPSTNAQDSWQSFLIETNNLSDLQQQICVKPVFKQLFWRWEVSNPSIWVCLWLPDLNLKPLTNAQGFSSPFKACNVPRAF